jgi:hypothetical protein
MVSRSEIDAFVAARGEPHLTSFHQLFAAPSHAMLDVTSLTPLFMYSNGLYYCLIFYMHLLHHTLDLASRSAWVDISLTRVLSLCRVFSSGLSTRYHRLLFCH